MRMCNASDYVDFTPSSNLSNCVLGEEIVVKQRKPDSICESDLSVQNMTSITSCNCTRSDYVCTFCFVPDPSVPGNPCILQQDAACAGLWDPTPPPASCPVGTYYVGDPAYRLITGTKCVNGIDLALPRSVPCPPPPPLPAPMPNTMNATVPQIATGGMPNKMNATVPQIATGGTPNKMNATVPQIATGGVPNTMNATVPQIATGEISNAAAERTGLIILGVFIGIALIAIVVYFVTRHIIKRQSFQVMRDTSEENAVEL